MPCGAYSNGYAHHGPRSFPQNPNGCERLQVELKSISANAMKIIRVFASPVSTTARCMLSGGNWFIVSYKVDVKLWRVLRYKIEREQCQAITTELRGSLLFGAAAFLGRVEKFSERVSCCISSRRSSASTSEITRYSVLLRAKSAQQFITAIMFTYSTSIAQNQFELWMNWKVPVQLRPKTTQSKSPKTRILGLPLSRAD